MNEWSASWRFRRSPKASTLSIRASPCRPGTCSPAKVSVGTQSLGAPPLPHPSQYCWAFLLAIELWFRCSDWSSACRLEDASFLGYAAGLRRPRGGCEVPWAGARLGRAPALLHLVRGRHGQRPREPLLQPHDDQWGGARQRIRYQGLGDAV